MHIMAGELTVNERVAVANAERQAQDEKNRGERLDLAADTLRALLDPRLSQEARHEVFRLIIEQREGEAISIDRQSEIGLQQQLGRAGDLVASLGASAHRMSEDATETAQHLEQNGLPD
jgi:hypothetical protein